MRSMLKSSKSGSGPAPTAPTSRNDPSPGNNLSQSMCGSSQSVDLNSPSSSRKIPAPPPKAKSPVPQTRSHQTSVQLSSSSECTEQKSNVDPCELTFKQKMALLRGEKVTPTPAQNAEPANTNTEPSKPPLPMKPNKPTLPDKPKATEIPITAIRKAGYDIVPSHQHSEDSQTVKFGILVTFLSWNGFICCNIYDWSPCLVCKATIWQFTKLHCSLFPWFLSVCLTHVWVMKHFISWKCDIPVLHSWLFFTTLFVLLCLKWTAHWPTADQKNALMLKASSIVVCLNFQI